MSPITALLVITVVSLSLMQVSDSVESCKSCHYQYDSSKSCPVSGDAGSINGSFYSYTTSGCVVTLSNNSQYYVSMMTSLYCGFNGDDVVGNDDNKHHRRTATITWISPTGGILHTARGNGESCNNTRLLLNTNEAADGLYTCTVQFIDAVYHLFVGVYRTGEAPPHHYSSGFQVMYNVSVQDRGETYTGVGLNWTTTGRPVGSVRWLIDSKNIPPTERYLTMDVLRSEVNVTYDHVLIIPWNMLNNLNQTYSIRLDCTVNITTPEIILLTVPPIPTDISFNSSSSVLTWIVDSSGGVSLTEKYHIEYNTSSSQCTSTDIRVKEVWLDDVTIEGVSTGRAHIQLELDANYTLHIKSSNFLHNSTWSSDYKIYLPSKAPSGAPKSLRVNQADHDQSAVTVEWEEVECFQRNGLVIGYSLKYSATPGSRWTAIRVKDNVTSYMVPGLTLSTQYSFKVAAINDAGEGVYSNLTNYTTPAVVSSVSVLLIACGTAGGIVPVVFFILIIAVVRKVHQTRRRKMMQVQHAVAEWNDYNSADTTFELEESPEVEPIIEDFPEDVDASLGEYLIFYVNVSSPTPFTITWFHNDQNVIADSTIEVRSEGTLSIPCVEDKHAGVYRMVVSNSYGSSSCELKLTLTEDESSSADGCMSASTDCEPIVVSSFEEYIASHHSKNNEAFHMQFMSLNSFDDDSMVGSSLENKHLNRYKHIYPYDKNCVSLEPISGCKEEQNTYINASYIRHDQNQQTKFIASQAPLPNTVSDFWHLVWQERVCVIVMLTSLTEGHRVRCQQYWPTTGSQTYGPFSVYLEKEDKLADYIIRRFTIFLTTVSEPPLSVTHYQFTSWPDHHTPDHAAPLLSLHSRVLNKYKTAKGPILVHCSAGVGRTGVFIALDIILEKAKKEGVVDVMGVVNKLRQQRMRMVQTVAQYIFIYDSVLEYLVCGDTQIQACNIRLALKKLRVIDREEGKSGFEKQYQVLKRITPNQCEVGGIQLAGTCSTLNRSIASLASEQRRGVPSGYLGATFIDGFRQKKAFIIAQGPSEDLCSDFWKMITRHKCGAVVMLSDKFEYNQEVCCQYWPVDGAMIHNDLSVELVSERTREDAIIRIFSLTQMKSREMSLMTQFQILNWTPDGHCSNYRTITSLLKDVVEVQMKTGNNPILVHCSDPVGRSTMFCAVMTVIERCKMEGIIDVFQVVKAMRMQKHGAIQSVDQYGFIFDIVLTYLDSMETYANFQ